MQLIDRRTVFQTTVIPDYADIELSKYLRTGSKAKIKFAIR